MHLPSGFDSLGNLMSEVQKQGKSYSGPTLADRSQ
jgi:hypothetical protein